MQIVNVRQASHAFSDRTAKKSPVAAAPAPTGTGITVTILSLLTVLKQHSATVATA